MASFTVAIEDRARLLTAVLAASDWPQEEQEQLTHAVHPHAKQTRQFVQAYRSHPAVIGVNQALLNGVSLEELFSTVLRSTWPTFEPAEDLPNVLQIKPWLHSLADFLQESAIATEFWPQHEGVWQTAVSALEAIFEDSPLPQFLERLQKQSLDQNIVVMPNLVFPALSPVLATSQDQLLLLLPPPKAVGESPPWPFDEDPAWAAATVCHELTGYLLAQPLAKLSRVQRQTIHHAAVTLCLAQAFDESEAQAYLLRVKKEHNLPDLPDVVAKLRDYLENGRTVADLTTLF